MSQNLLGGPAPTLLPDLPEATQALADGMNPYDVAAKFPQHPAAWATLAEYAFTKGSVIDSYAYARTGYHRGLDALRRAGWKGQGPIPWEHEPNRGFLRCLASLSKAAAAIGEDEEAERCKKFLHDSSESAAEALA